MVIRVDMSELEPVQNYQTGQIRSVQSFQRVWSGTGPVRPDRFQLSDMLMEMRLNEITEVKETKRFVLHSLLILFQKKTRL